MSKHTPTPWMVDGNETTDWITTTEDKGFTIIASLDNSKTNDVMKANADFIV